jgi:hypothetical protein
MSGQIHASVIALTPGIVPTAPIVWQPDSRHLREQGRLRLREQYRLRVFMNWVLRKAFGMKGEGATADWRKVGDEELQDLYSAPNSIPVMKSRRMRWAAHVARMGQKRNIYTYKFMVGK